MLPVKDKKHKIDPLCKEGDLYFFGSIQSHWEPTDDPNYRGTFMTRETKLKTVKKFDETTRIPLCIDHAGGTDPGFQVPREHILGYVTGLGVDHENDLLMTGYVDSSRPELSTIIADMLTKKKYWGLSAYTRFLYENERCDSVIPGSQEITHVGITLEPALAEEGSYIFEYGLSPEKINAIIRERDIGQRALLASETSLERWGVAPNVKQHVVTVLDLNISDPAGRPTESALPPPPIYDTRDSVSSVNSSFYETEPAATSSTVTETTATAESFATIQSEEAHTKMSATNLGDGVAKISVPSNGTPENKNSGDENKSDFSRQVKTTGSVSASDNMDIEATGSDAGADAVNDGQSTQLSPDQVANGLIKALQEVLQQADSIDNDIEKEARLSDAYGNFIAELRSRNVHLEDLPPEVDDLRARIRNSVTAIREDWATSAQKMGSANNNFNKDMAEKLRANGTLPEERRQLASYVRAAKDAARTAESRSQKDYEMKLMQLKKDNDAMVADLKRKHAEVIEENERLKRRTTEASVYARQNVSNYAPSFLGGNGSQPTSRSQPGQQQQQQQPLSAESKSGLFTYNQAPTQQSKGFKPPGDDDAMDVEQTERRTAQYNETYFDSTPKAVIRASSDEQRRGKQQQTSSFIIEDGDRLTTVGFGGGNFSARPAAREGYTSATGFHVDSSMEYSVKSANPVGVTYASRFILSPEQTSFGRAQKASNPHDRKVFTNILSALVDDLERNTYNSFPLVFLGDGPVGHQMPDHVLQGVTESQFNRLVENHRSY